MLRTRYITCRIVLSFEQLILTHLQVIETICKSMVSDGAPLSQKIARLYLVSDILHNSSVHVTNAWKYRSGFEVKLPEVFQHFNKIYRSIRARLKAEQVRVSVAFAVQDDHSIKAFILLLCSGKYVEYLQFGTTGLFFQSIGSQNIIAYLPNQALSLHRANL
jgi:hypothetical protein